MEEQLVGGVDAEELISALRILCECLGSMSKARAVNALLMAMHSLEGQQVCALVDYSDVHEYI